MALDTGNFDVGNLAVRQGSPKGTVMASPEGAWPSSGPGLDPLRPSTVSNYPVSRQGRSPGVQSTPAEAAKNALSPQLGGARRPDHSLQTRDQPIAP